MNVLDYDTRFALRILPINETFLFLPISPHSRGGLLVCGWVPVRVEQDQAVTTNPAKTYVFICIAGSKRRLTDY